MGIHSSLRLNFIAKRHPVKNNTWNERIIIL